MLSVRKHQWAYRTLANYRPRLGLVLKYYKKLKFSFFVIKRPLGLGDEGLEQLWLRYLLSIKIPHLRRSFSPAKVTLFRRI